METSIILNEMIMLFFILIIGYIANKCGVLTREGNKVLSKIIINITLSALIIASVMDTKIQMPLKELGLLLFFAFFAYAILSVIAFLTPRVLRVKKEDRGLYSFMAMFGNVGFMGIPILFSLYGQEAVFYAALFNIPFNLLLYSAGIFMVSPHEKIKVTVKTFANAPFVASVVAIIVYVLPFSYPAPVVQGVTILGDMTIPGAMLVIGASLGGIAIKEVFMDFRVYLVSLIKLLVCPLVLWVCLKPFLDNPLLLAVAVITTAMPVATNATMLCMEYHGNETLSSKGIFISTVLSIFTIPLVLLVL